MPRVNVTRPLSHTSYSSTETHSTVIIAIRRTGSLSIKRQMSPVRWRCDDVWQASEQLLRQTVSERVSSWLTETVITRTRRRHTTCSLCASCVSHSWEGTRIRRWRPVHAHIRLWTVVLFLSGSCCNEFREVHLNMRGHMMFRYLTCL